MNLAEYSSKCAIARNRNDWAEVTKLSHELLVYLKRERTYKESDLRTVAKNYLGSIVGSGDFLISRDLMEIDRFHKSANEFLSLIQSSDAKFEAALNSELRDLREIQLFLSKDESSTRNKAASSLRRIGRPHLAIELASYEISKSRLNYYARVIRGSAYNDIGAFDEAIEDGEIALKYSLPDKKYYPLIVLARAKTGNCKKYGLISDGEESVVYALRALQNNESIYTAKIFISAVRTVGAEEHEALISHLERKYLSPERKPDPVAAEIATSVIVSTFQDDNSDEGLEWLNDPDSLDQFEYEFEESSTESISDYFEDYFEEFSDSLNDPQQPHLEP